MKSDNPIFHFVRPCTLAHSSCRPEFTATLACALSWLVMATSMAEPVIENAPIDPAALRLPSEVPVIGAW